MMTLEKYKEIDSELISRVKDFDEFKEGEPIYRIGDFGYVYESDFIEVCGSEENQALYVLLANHEDLYDSLEQLFLAYIDGDISEDYEPDVVYYTEGEGVYTDALETGSVVSLDDDLIMDLFSSVCYDSVFGLYPYLEDDVYDKVREQIEPRFSDDILCYEDVLLEALKQGILKAYDTEDEKSYDLTTDMLEKGLKIYLNLDYTNKDLASMDAIDWANLLQCAIFEDIIYG